ncbi:unnamed protein product [Ilex paraguariensis]|uniref:Uncharacterized protein n=1 Tax=Ilex paraguariensis TaxID=185542 RepID=A0ABC8TMC2_9AQUA
MGDANWGPRSRGLGPVKEGDTRVGEVGEGVGGTIDGSPSGASRGLGPVKEGDTRVGEVGEVQKDFGDSLGNTPPLSSHVGIKACGDAIELSQTLGDVNESLGSTNALGDMGIKMGACEKRGVAMLRRTGA